MKGELQEQILKDTYNYDYFPNMQYYGGQYEDENYGNNQPTFEFLDAWNFRVYKNTGNPKLSLYFVPSMLGKKAHKSIRGGGDPTKNLADILNLAFEGYQEGYTSGLMVGSVFDTPDGQTIDTTRHMSKLRRPYWKNFTEKMTKKGGVRKLIKEEAKKQGIKLE